MQAVAYKFNMTKEWVDAFPCAYRQWKADTHCNKIHGYSFDIKLFFGSDELDVRNWTFGVEYGGLKPLKQKLEEMLDHTLLVAEDDPELETFKILEEKGIAKLTILPKLGCEALADLFYKYINTVFMEEAFGEEAASKTWCYRVEVRETQSNMAFREGHREWNEDLLE